MRAVPAPFALVVLACLVLAALSLLLPSSPTYDPWAWIVWGREILHLDLSTVEGPSWKPLPMLFTIPFALTGPDVAPQLWLVVARAGALLAVVAAFQVGRRLAGGVIAGGAAPAAGLLIAPWFLRTCTLGNSEGLMVACVLGAIDRHLAGSRRAAFVLAVAAGLLRPEAWPFLGLYGLWLLWREPADRWRVVAGGVLIPLAWFPPELWGSGNLLRASDRAQNPRADSAAFAEDPVRQVLDNAAAMVTWPVWAGVAVLLAVLIGHRGGRPDRRPAVVLGVLALVWVGLVAYMTKDGFSGNQRYLIVPVTLVMVLAGGGLGRAVGLLGARAAARPVALGLGVLAAVLFAAPSVGRLDATLTNLRYQGELPHQLARAVDAAGGAARLKACGKPYTGAFLVPAVAWQLRVHTSEVQLEPAVPAVVFRVRTNPGSRPVPAFGAVGSAPLATLATQPDWRIVAACR